MNPELVNQAIKNMSDVILQYAIALAAVGATVNEIAKTTTYVVNYSADVRPALHAARQAVFSAEPPANTLIGVQSLALPEFLIEIEAIAILD